MPVTASAPSLLSTHAGSTDAPFGSVLAPGRAGPRVRHLAVNEVLDVAFGAAQLARDFGNGEETE
jgi:hypothetical protein